MLVSENRLRGYHIDILKDELLGLRIIKGNKVDHQRKGCFVGETRIPLLDGSRPMISELVGKDSWVYSSTPDGEIVPGKAKAVLTKNTSSLVDVILDTGAVIRCTPEHPFMLRNGEYKEAQNLRPGIDRLMPINFAWPVNGGYERVTNKNGEKSLTHHMVVKGMGEVIPEGWVVHHKNHDKTDNSPQNLSVVDPVEHSRLHTTLRHKTDPDYVAALAAGRARFNSLPETRQKRSNYMSSHTKDWYLQKARNSKTFRSDITIESLMSVKNDPEAANANVVSRILGCGRNVVIRVLGEAGYSSWDEFVNTTGHNHKVRSVIWIELESPVPVYDLQVDKWHNFALPCGIFVHNSNDLADAICGAAYNASKYTPRNTDRIIDIQYLEPSAPKPSLADLAIPKPKAPAGVRPAADLSSWIEQMKIID
jgi:tRNA-splicing ligase RtcB